MEHVLIRRCERLGMERYEGHGFRAWGGPYYSEHFKEICILRADGTQQLLEVGDSLRVGKRQRLIGIPFDC